MLEFAIIEINYVSSSFWSQKKEEGLLREVQTLELITLRPTTTAD